MLHGRHTQRLLAPVRGSSAGSEGIGIRPDRDVHVAGGRRSKPASCRVDAHGRTRRWFMVAPITGPPGFTPDAIETFVGGDVMRLLGTNGASMALICGDCLGTGFRGSDHVGYKPENGTCPTCVDGRVSPTCQGPHGGWGDHKKTCKEPATTAEGFCVACQDDCDDWWQQLRADRDRLAGSNGGYG
jgi:hypothetical protein